MIYYVLSALGGFCLGVVLMSLLNAASERREAARFSAALWEIIHGIRRAGLFQHGVRAILKKHGIEVPEGEVVF